MLQYTGSLAKLGLPDAVTRWCFQSEVAERLKKLHEFLHQVKFAIGRWKDLRCKVDRFGATAPTLLSLGQDTEDPACAGKIGHLRATLASLPQLVALNRAISAAGDLGLQRWVDAIIVGDIPADQAADTFDRTVHERLAENLIRKNPCLADFSRLGIEGCRERFKKLDREIMQQAPLWVAASCTTRAVVRGISTGRVAELTEMGLIRHEIQKQTRFCRIRELVRRAGLSLQALKPCFMMSPLSVAQFLPAGGFQFDLVIMDEASQVKPEDALGAAARAKQLVVVGDRNQLPPTSFFDRLGDEQTPEEIETFLDNSESILDVAAKSFPSRRLKWHYRSQHESLITFSNERFYDGELVVFPSPTRDAGTLGVHFHFVDSGRFTGGCNPAEADIVARAVVEQAKSGTNESVGVGTLNAEQQSAIEDRLDAICSQDAEAIAAVQRLRDHADPLFVKNLENLQGDERDIIFISCTYGPDPLTGKVFNRFGPMNGAQGWRRLNVLITRARRRVEVFSSMRSGDIHASLESDTDSDRRSLSSLRGYLEFAETGRIRDPGTGTERGADSMFEIAVARVVRATGLEVVAQVGVAGFFIDMGVLKPGSTDEFLFGIECDGATYHSSKSARDRDRLREEIIVARGWRLYRIWSTDWFTNQHAEEERLRRFIATLV